MADTSLLSILSLGTLVAVCGVALFMFARVRNSQAKRGEKPGGMAGPSP